METKIEKYNHLQVLRIYRIRQYNNSAIMAECLCDCGSITQKQYSHVKKLIYNTCGCRSFEKPIPIIKHGLHGTCIYNIWRGMKGRCLRPSDKKYKDYGGRGIRIYEPWINSVEKFAMYVGPRPSIVHSIDRIDNNGNYEPVNVRWATRKVQANNQRTNRLICIDGDTKTVTQWAEILGITPQAIQYRLKNGWSLKDCISIGKHGKAAIRALLIWR